MKVLIVFALTVAAIVTGAFADEKGSPMQQTENLRICVGLDLIEREKHNPANVVIPIEDCQLEGFQHDLAYQYREASVRLMARKGRIIGTVPRAGRWHVGFIFYDTTSPSDLKGDERFALYIAGKRRGTMVADIDNNRQHLFVLEKPLDLVKGDKIELVTLTTEGIYRTEDLLLLAKLPPAWKRRFDITDLTALPLRDVASPSVRVTWITTWPTKGRVEYGSTPQYGNVVEESVAANCHRVVLTGLKPDATYHYRIVCPRSGGGDVSTAPATFVSTAAPLQGTARRQRVEVEVLRQRYTGAAHIPASGGVPFPKGALGSSENVRLLDADGKEVPAQVRVSARWPDGSIKWVLLDCQPEFPPNDPAKLVLEYGADVQRKAFASPLTVEENPNAILVTTGPARFEVSRKSFGPFGRGWADADGDGVFADTELVSAAEGWAGSVVTDSNGVEHTSLSAPDEVTLEESGPLKVVILVRGRHTGPGGEKLYAYEARIVAYAGKPYVRVHYAFGNDMTDRIFTEVRSIELRWPLNRAGSGLSPVGRAKEGAPLAFSQLTADLHETMQGQSRQEKKGRLAGWLASVADGRAVGVAVRDFWQHYPKALSLGPKGIEIGICPPLRQALYEKECSKISRSGVPAKDYLYWYLKTGNYRFKCGSGKRHELLFSFASTDFASEAEMLNNPPVLRCAPEWYARTKAFGDIAGPEQKVYPSYDEMFTDAVGRYLGRRERYRLYGLLNFGDWWFGPGRYRSWGNIEYDMQHAFLLQWVRGGDLRFFFAGEQAARHNMDVDIMRFHPQARGVGFVYRHETGHFGRRSGLSRGYWTTNNGCHSWTEGLCDYYLLTGDRRAIETARIIADLHDTYKATNFDFKNARKAGWHLILTMGVYRATNDPFYLNAAKIMVERVREKQTADGAWMRRAGSGECRDTPRCRMNSVFCVAILMSGLKMLHEDSADPRALDSLTKAADFMKAMWVEERKSFHYTSCRNDRKMWSMTFSLDGIAYVYRRTGDRQLGHILRTGLDEQLTRRLPPNGKPLAQMTRAMPFILYNMEAMAE